jgi:hypothetical protein
VSVQWQNGRVTTEQSVATTNAVTGKTLRDSFWTDIQALTFGLVRAHDSALRLGPLELIRFGPARVTRSGVSWPIDGGLLARAPGGRLRFETLDDRLEASLEGYQPTLPRALYVVTQLPIHLLWTRLHLLRVRGRTPAPGVTADPSRRLAAGAIDAGLCVALASLSSVAGRRRRLTVLLGVTAGYHVACWTLSGRTLGGAVMKQRVVAVDGSNLTAGQALLRLAALPLAALGRNLHDDIAGTDVVAL